MAIWASDVGRLQDVLEGLRRDAHSLSSSVDVALAECRKLQPGAAGASAGAWGEDREGGFVQEAAAQEARQAKAHAFWAAAGLGELEKADHEAVEEHLPMPPVATRFSDTLNRLPSSRETLKLQSQLPPVLRRRWRLSEKSREAEAHQSMERFEGPALAGIWRSLFMAHAWEIQALKAQEQGKDILNEMLALQVRSARRRGEADPEDLEGRRPLTPESRRRRIWDCLIFLVLLADVFTVPLNLAWATDIAAEDLSSLVWRYLTLVFWSCDMWLSFRTAFLKHGVYETRRPLIARHYLKTWFAPDACLLALDIWAALAVSLGSRDVQIIMSFRALRLMRLVKLRVVLQALDNFLGTMQTLLMVTLVCRQLLFTYILVHIAACIWYFIGRRGAELGVPNWHETVSFGRYGAKPVHEEYVLCIVWVLGHWTPAPGVASVTSQNPSEYLFTAIVTFSSLLVIGGVVAGINTAIADLTRLSVGFRDMTRQVNTVMIRYKVPEQLRARVHKFASYSFKQRKAITTEETVLALLNDRLKTELAVSCRQKHFGSHPLFEQLIAEHPDTFRKACDAFRTRVFVDDDVLFNEGQGAEGAYVTNRGEFLITYLAQNMEITSTKATQQPVLRELDLTEPGTWLAELSLYMRFVHQCSLVATSYGDAFTLTCQAFADCVKDSPACIGLVYEYGKVFVARSKAAGGTMRNDMLPADLVPMEFSRASVQVLHQRSSKARAPPPSMLPVDEFFNRLYSKEKPWTVDDVIEWLPHTFRELCPTTGLYANMGYQDEWGRAVCSMSSVICLALNRYSDFVRPQIRNTMTIETWNTWQDFVEWADLSRERLHGVLVFLCLRGLGKIKGLERMCGHGGVHGPEEIVLHLMHQLQKSVPSAPRLDPELRTHVELSIECVKGFNLPQFLQGECVPYNLSVLQAVVADHGPAFLKFFLTCQVGIMCGIFGADVTAGCKFMNEDNSTNILDALVRLRRLGQDAPQEVYWGYILLRSGRLGMPMETLEEIVLARLSCLCRCSSKDLGPLRAAWTSLSPMNRRLLCDHFLADGIGEQAFIFTFLPAYFANAKANPAIGLSRALLLLLDLIEFLDGEGLARIHSSSVATVDLQDVASTLNEISSRKLLLSLSSHLRLLEHEHKVQILVALDFKERLRTRMGPDNQLADLPALVRRMERVLNNFEEPQLMSPQDSQPPSFEEPEPASTSQGAVGSLRSSA